MRTPRSFLFGFDLVQVLHMDRNDYYGGDSASLNLTQVRAAGLALAHGNRRHSLPRFRHPCPP